MNDQDPPKHHEYGTEELGQGIPEAVVIQEFLRAIAGGLRQAIPPTYGFMVMIFEYVQPDDKGSLKDSNLFYISSAQRDDMLKAMGEFIERNSPGSGPRN